MVDAQEAEIEGAVLRIGEESSLEFPGCKRPFREPGKMLLDLVPAKSVIGQPFLKLTVTISFQPFFESQQACLGEHPRVGLVVSGECQHLPIAAPRCSQMHPLPSAEPVTP